MTSVSVGRRSVLAALGAVLVLGASSGTGRVAGDTGWSSVFITAAARDAGIVRTGVTSALVVYYGVDSPETEEDESSGPQLIRTRDSGATWSAPAPVPGSLTRLSLSSAGSSVDLAGIDSADRVAYQRSVDRGRTWLPARRLSAEGRFVYTVDIDRSVSGDQVSVAWVEAGGVVRTRTSVDGGAHFAPARRLGTTVLGRNWPGSPAAKIAVADSVTYVAFTPDDATIRVRRSLDQGETWTTSASFGGLVDAEVSGLDAGGRVAIVGYRLGSGARSSAVYRRTSDSGAGWSRVRVLATGGHSQAPQIDFRAGRWMATYQRDFGWLYFESSIDGGLTWTSPQIICDYEGWCNTSQGATFVGGRYLVPWSGASSDFDLTTYLFVERSP